MPRLTPEERLPKQVSLFLLSGIAAFALLRSPLALLQGLGLISVIIAILSAYWIGETIWRIRKQRSGS